jgi:spermidine/putrescine transport system permease protein
MRGHKSIIYPYFVWVLIFTVVPLLLIVYYSLHATVDGAYVLTGENFRRIFEKSADGGSDGFYLYLGIIGRSVRLAAVCTVICFIFGYPIGYILAGKEFNARNTVIFLFLIPMWMNVLLRTYAWLTILENNGILNSVLVFFGLPRQTMLYTEAAVVLGMVYNFIPFMILPVYTVLKKLDPNLVEAAQDLGADNRRVLLKVLFPLSVPGVISGVTMVFMPAVTTFVISNLLGGGQFILIGNLIEQQFLRAGNWGFGSALSAVLIAMILISVGIFSAVDKDAGSQGGTLY